jgi:hypothetical protein
MWTLKMCKNFVAKVFNLDLSTFIRFGKRGNTNGYLNKEYADYNILRYLLQNPEVLENSLI